MKEKPKKKKKESKPKKNIWFYIFLEVYSINFVNSIEMFSFQIQWNKDFCIQRVSLLKLGEKK